MDIDLQQFCSTDGTRWYLTKPFSMGEFSFATNGHILVRQPRRADVPDIDAKAPKFDPSRVLDGMGLARFYAPRFHLPAAPDGHVSCPERRMSVSIAGVCFALNYVRQMLALPGIEIANTASGVIADRKPMLFQFDRGGVGALMALHSPWADHFDIEQGGAS